MMQIKSDQRRSFSFSSFDFNSSNNNSAGFFSSSDDEFYASNFVMYDTEDDDDDGAYIEINLNPTQTAVVVVVDDDDGGGIKRNFHVDQDKKEYSNSSEVELRISFSSSAAGIPPPSTCGTTQHAQGPTTTTTKPPGRLLVSLARIMNEFMAASSAKISNSVTAIEANNNVDCEEIIRSRKDCTMVANSKRNGIMNFIVKFKYKDIPSMLVSMVTPKAKSGQMRATRQPLLQDPMNDNMKLKTRNDQDQNCDKSTSSSSVGGIINFKAMRGILDALIVKTSRYYTSARTGELYANNKSKSCPSSIKSSPMHSNIVCGDDDEVRRFYSTDNSVQAAIAHCKKSFGTQPEFDFSSLN